MYEGYSGNTTFAESSTPFDFQTLPHDVLDQHLEWEPVVMVTPGQIERDEKGRPGICSADPSRLALFRVGQIVELLQLRDDGVRTKRYYVGHDAELRQLELVEGRPLPVEVSTRIEGIRDRYIEPDRQEAQQRMRASHPNTVDADEIGAIAQEVPNPPSIARRMGRFLLSRLSSLRPSPSHSTGRHHAAEAGPESYRPPAADERRTSDVHSRLQDGPRHRAAPRGRHRR